MARENIATKDYTVKINSNGGHSPGDYGSFTKIVELEASVLQVDGVKVVKGPVIIRMASGCSFSGYTFVTGVGSLSPNCDKVHADGFKCYKKGTDVGSCNGVFTLSATPFTPYACSCSWDIDDPKQTLVFDGED